MACQEETDGDHGPAWWQQASGIPLPAASSVQHRVTAVSGPHRALSAQPSLGWCPFPRVCLPAGARETEDCKALSGQLDHEACSLSVL